MDNHIFCSGILHKFLSYPDEKNNIQYSLINVAQFAISLTLALET